MNDKVGVLLALGQPKPCMFEEVVRIVGPISSEDGPIVGGRVWSTAPMGLDSG